MYTAGLTPDGGAKLEISEDRFVLTYQERRKSSRTMATPAPPASPGAPETGTVWGIIIYRAGMLRSPLYSDLPEGRYPIMTFTSNGQDTAFLSDVAFIFSR